MNKYSDAFIKALKETGRLVVFGVVATFISALNAEFNSLPQDQVTVFLTLILRAADKFIHEEKTIKKDGILPF